MSVDTSTDEVLLGHYHGECVRVRSLTSSRTRSSPFEVAEFVG